MFQNIEQFILMILAVTVNCFITVPLLHVHVSVELGQQFRNVFLRVLVVFQISSFRLLDLKCFFFSFDSRSDSFADFSQFNPAAASSSSSATASNDLLDVFGNTPASVSSSGNMGNPAMSNMNMSGMNQPMMGVNMNMGMSGVPNQVNFIIFIKVIKCKSIFGTYFA